MEHKPEILIKSFNRPYYLDRCLASIYRFCHGFSGIKVLDDGTPPKYIDKILQKYPEVKIVLSEQYEEKNKAIEENLQSSKEINGFKIPVKMWKDAVRHSTSFFVITEDDVWFTHQINLAELQQCMISKNTDLVKLGNLGRTPNGKKETCGNDNLIYPELKFLSFPKKPAEAFFYNRFKFFSLLYKLKMVDNYTIGTYYELISILMGMYRKDYWLKLWEGIDQKVDEKRQLMNASLHYRKHRNNPFLIGVLENENMKTTFKSSATNSYHKYGYDFDVNRFNFILNEYWFNDELNVFENFPKDFSDACFMKILSEHTHPKAQPEEWQKWAAQFKKQYSDMGCVVE
ncbi:glycosyltransferase family 2 protein [Chryseobacterium manosquense]|uniref:Glycosyltransferase family 2 protein n=1 Tax=Chryseobacterium manosquense TaxID=2754694 RepID=A0A7H1DUG8_9FLAO|nr:glycosyltransferase family 2 protein [Chryseobacterium manosquense]QNS40626.1 glycosyltransferase family 2 protein [Chryseobacterium manosquense]